MIFLLVFPRFSLGFAGFLEGIVGGGGGGGGSNRCESVGGKSCPWVGELCSLEVEDGWGEGALEMWGEAGHFFFCRVVVGWVGWWQ